MGLVVYHTCGYCWRFDFAPMLVVCPSISYMSSKYRTAILKRIKRIEKCRIRPGCVSASPYINSRSSQPTRTVRKLILHKIPFPSHCEAVITSRSQDLMYRETRGSDKAVEISLVKSNRSENVLSLPQRVSTRACPLQWRRHKPFSAKDGRS